MRFPNILKRLPFVFAAFWSVYASISLHFAPLYTVHKVEYPNVEDPSEVIVQVSSATLYEANGPRAVVILVIFAFLFTSTAVLAIRSRYIALAVLSILATALTIMAMLSIGGAYIPAVVAVAAGWIVIGLERLFTCL